jgi:lauroyl/myristoyl acyltransferase
MYVRRYPGLWLWMHRRWRDVDAATAGARGMFPSAATEDDG